MADPRGLAMHGAAQRAASAPVWDVVVRGFHWTVVAGCTLNLFVLDPSSAAHRAIGYAVAAALTVRLVWGFVGTVHARFADFVPTPATLARYLAALAHGRARRHLGHNPAGAAMMLALMTLLAATALTGWMLGLNAFWGSPSLQALHGGLANAILVLALVHVAAAVLESWRHGENLVWAMVTGRKRRDGPPYRSV